MTSKKMKTRRAGSHKTKLTEEEKAMEKAFREATERRNMMNNAELQRLKREASKQKKSKSRQMKTLAKKPRPGNQSVSDDKIIATVNAVREEGINERNIVNVVLQRLDREGEKPMTPQNLRKRMKNLKLK